MKNLNITRKLFFLGISTLFLVISSCERELQKEPTVEVTAKVIYKDFANYPKALGGIYAELANGDLDYVRLMYNLQVVTTDEAVIGWNDGNLPDLHKMTWNSSNEFIELFYNRIYIIIAYANEFLKNTTDEKLSEYGISGDNLIEAKYMRAEARFLRAQSYYQALDMFGNVPMVLDTDPIGNLPKRIERADLFKFIESELKDIETELKNPKTNEYGRVDKAAAWALLARLYLNAKVYTGNERNDDVITYTNKIITAGYSLKPKYEDLFLADNNLNNPEVILSINFDGMKTRTWGGATYLVHGPIGGEMNPKDFGVGGAWGGMRVTKNFVNKFTDPNDKRGNFFTKGQTLEINDLGDFKSGYAFIKYKNITSSGEEGSDGPSRGSGEFPDTDVPIYRLGDVYLMYAEATLRGGNGNRATALGYINALKRRAEAQEINDSELTLDFILDERSRELSWEFTRRTDLVRFGKFTSASYLWPWKGGVKDGKSVENFRNLFPIPANDIIANRNLIQNPGY